MRYVATIRRPVSTTSRESSLAMAAPLHRPAFIFNLGGRLVDHMYQHVLGRRSRS